MRFSGHDARVPVLSACSVCGVEVRIEVVRPTTPEDFEYRFQAVILRYWVEDQIHLCRLRPGMHVAYSEPQEAATPINSLARPSMPVTREWALTSAARFLDVE